MALVAVMLIPTVSIAGELKLTYPKTRRMDLVDVLHGVKVPDPYRWLEDDVRKSKEVAAWVEQQNKVTSAYLKSLPARERIEKRLTKLWDFEKYSSPFRRGGRYYFSKNDGLQNQSVLYTLDKLNGEPKVLMDPNTWSKDGTVALAGTAFSDDGKFVAYGVQESGSDWRTWRVMEIETRRVLADELKWVKFSSATWTRDSRGFFYGRYQEPKDGEAFQNVNLNQQIYYHRVGTSQADDVLVYQRPDHPDWGFGVDVTEDGRYMVITVWKGTDDRYRVLYRDLGEPYAMPVDLIDNFENEYTFIGNDGTNFFFQTDLKAPRKRVVSIDINKPQREHWTEIIPEREQTLRSVGIVGNLLVAEYLEDAKTAVRMHALSGEFVRNVEFPGIGSASGFGGRRTETETFYSFSSFATPPTIYRYDMITGKSTQFRQAKVDFDPDKFTVKQVFYASKDGTKVPMFIAHRKDIKLDGKNPTLLYGYGGFTIPLTPRFSISRLNWMEMGGVFAMPNLRGGGEYGVTWHKAGTKLHKQNVFDDFIAAAEWLIEHKYTNSKQLAIQGGSNGGLLVGACMSQRPELFGACLPAVGVMDMLRFHKFTAGRFWVDDYGSPD
ncbi:MAG: prolyl oligopeptidase family serine peptidase, partial [Planctomycetota bacterium]|nr:prolyl oligopeptidase family serine peptidase [Planctomycetota bacterium]